jgi:hypothetical protein
LERDIHANLGVLEEQLEKVEDLFDRIDFGDGELRSEITNPVLDELRLAIANASSIRESLEENLLWEKCFPLASVMERFFAYLISEASKQNADISIAYSEQGKIPLSIAQGLIPAILSYIQILAERAGEDDNSSRRAESKLGTKAVIFVLEGASDFFSITILDDACGADSEPIRHKKEFQKIRASVAKFQGFCSFSRRSHYGHEFRMKVPMPRSRVSALELSCGNATYIVPEMSLYELVPSASKGSLKAGESGSIFFRFQKVSALLCTIDPIKGIQFAESEFPSDFEGRMIALLGAADSHVAILINSEPRKIQARIESARDWLDEGAWFKDFALFSSGSKPSLSPYISGDVIVEALKLLQVKI